MEWLNLEGIDDKNNLLRIFVGSRSRILVLDIRILSGSVKSGMTLARRWKKVKLDPMAETRDDRKSLTDRIGWLERKFSIERRNSVDRRSSIDRRDSVDRRSSSFDRRDSVYRRSSSFDRRVSIDRKSSVGSASYHSLELDSCSSDESDSQEVNFEKK
jgi:hypothetical protein